MHCQVNFLPAESIDLPASESEVANGKRFPDSSFVFGNIAVRIEGVRVTVESFVTIHSVRVGDDQRTILY